MKPSNGQQENTDSQKLQSCIDKAKQFCFAAYVLDDTVYRNCRYEIPILNDEDELLNRPRSLDLNSYLWVPTLTAAAQGLEHIVKACLYLNGATPETSGRAGHNIPDMWQHPACAQLHSRVRFQAYSVTKEIQTHHYFGMISPDDAGDVATEAILVLAELQFSNKLRYTPKDDERAP